jgi:hydroxymethylglutaryl-CoA lyase
MADTKEVIGKLNLQNNGSRLLAIVANQRGAEDAVNYDEISFLGFPFSISPTFQLRNTNSSIDESLIRVEKIQELCRQKNKELVIYLSMGFGNPYGDEYNAEILLKWADIMVQRGIGIISLADTVGLATPDQISFALKTLIPQYRDIKFGVHLHSTPANWKEKLDAAIQSGCRRVDGALKGVGGCPMAGNELVGNMNTELIINYLEEHQLIGKINHEALSRSLEIASRIFG